MINDMKITFTNGVKCKLPYYTHKDTTFFKKQHQNPKIWVSSRE